MEFKDYYAVLGIGRNATPDEIKKAYRKLARRRHPDVNPGDRAAEKQFKEINEAHEVLGDPDARRKYDALSADRRAWERARAGGAQPFRFGGSPQGGVRWNVGPDGSQSFSGFSEFFETFFGGAAPGGAPPGRRAAGSGDVERVIELGLDQALRGSAQRISIDRGGRRSTVDVRIPAGVTDGSRIRVPGAAGPGAGGAAGDLLLRVRLKPHPRFTLRGRNLHVNVAVPVPTAVLGGEVEVATLDGTVRLRIPAATQPGQVFRLRGRGMPGAGGRSRPGDLLATAEVTVPKRLDAAARSHYEALAALEETARREDRRTVA